MKCLTPRAIIVPAVAALIVVQTAVVSPAPFPADEPPVRSSHGDWQVRCSTPAGAPSEQCVLMQFVVARDQENVALTVIILRTADRKAKIMRLLAPLGVLLPSGLGLKIDGMQMGRADFVRCLPNGCVAEVLLDDAVLARLGRGKTATFIMFLMPVPYAGGAPRHSDLAERIRGGVEVAALIGRRSSRDRIAPGLRNPALYLAAGPFTLAPGRKFQLVPCASTGGPFSIFQFARKR